jgi:O-succinylbenzoate synthase
VTEMSDLYIIFYKRIAWRLHLHMTEAQVFEILLESIPDSEGRLCANTKLTFHKALGNS